MKKHWSLAVAGFLATLPICSALATIVGPYTPDTNTLHLWHFDELSAPALDSVSNGTNLTALANGATLANPAYAGFGNALSTAAESNAYCAAVALVNGTGDDTTMIYADPVTGAFTYEALVRIDFNPATFTRTLPLYIITGENDSSEPNSTRAFQFRIMPDGAALTGSSTTDYRLHFFNAKDNGSYLGIIPITGSNAIAQGNWYHVAVTYDGNDSTAGNTKLYWTLVDTNRVKADELPGTTLVAITDQSTNATPDFTIGNVGRTTPNSSFPGLIDEVRMSKIARSPVEMLFNSTQVTIVTQPVDQAIFAGQGFALSVTASGTPTLTYQWRLNGSPLVGAQQSTYVVSSVSQTNSGSYDVIVSNSTSAATSTVATVTIISADPILNSVRSGSNRVFTWLGSSIPMVLQCASNLASPVNWQPVTNWTVINGNDYTVTVPDRGPQLFFRLAGVVNPATNAVRPIDWSAFNAGLPTDTNAQRSKNILQNACKYALTTWWNTARNFDAQDATNYLNLGGIGESNIRSPAMEAYGLAVALQTGAYDPVAAGVSVSDARTRMLKLIRSLAYSHLVNKSGGWGNDWQTALWANLAGCAGWMCWTNLSGTDQEYLRRMVEYEANRFTNYAVPYYQNRSGTIIYSGDTKCEENAWNAAVLHLALCMMPAHANATLWWNKAIELSISTYARPSDMSRTNVYHGRTLAAWLNGSNENEDGTVINHNIVHPDYMSAGLGYFHADLVYALCGKPTPLAGFFNLDQTYHALVDLNFVVGAIPYPTGLTNRPPGGYLYARDALNQPTGNIYYPNGNDWGTSRRMHMAAMDGLVHSFGFDSSASIPGDLWEAQHLQAVLDMQARFTDGRTYGATAEDTYGLREEWVCDLAGKSFLTKWLANQGPIQINNSPFSPFALPH